MDQLPATARQGQEKESIDLVCVKHMLLHRRDGDDVDDHNYLNVVGIFGIAGVGKTALAKEIYNELKSTFEPHIWISLSKLLLTVEKQSRKLTLVKHILTRLESQQGETDRFIEHLNKKKQEETPKKSDPKPASAFQRTASKLGINKSKESQPEKEKKEQDQPETGTGKKPDPPGNQLQAAPSTPTKKATKPDKTRQNEIGRKADPDHDPILGGLLWALHRKLTGKKYLIVLDGVFDSFDEPWYRTLGSRFEGVATATQKWEDRLGFGFPKGRQGGAVIVTGRSEKAVKNMVGEENCYRLLPVNITSCWRIYREAAEEGGEIRVPEDENLKELVFKKCEGLPLVAKMTGQISNRVAKIMGQIGNRKEEAIEGSCVSNDDP